MINFDDLAERFESFTPIRLLLLEQMEDDEVGSKNKLNVMYNLALDIAEAFVVLDDNYNDDLSFFAPSLKPRVKQQAITLRKPNSNTFLPEETVIVTRSFGVLPLVNEEEEDDANASSFGKGQFEDSFTGKDK